MPRSFLRTAALVACVTVLQPVAIGAPTVAPGTLPPEVAAALDRGKLSRGALVAVVEEVGTPRQRLSYLAGRPANPASLMKLVTTFAGLELLGPAWRWSTPVWLDGTVVRGVLDGNLVIKGSGDPTLVLERLWLLLRRVQQAGVREIKGDIVLDRSAFALPSHDPAAFDGEPFRPSNADADALLVNYHSLVLGFIPDAVKRIASVTVDMPLAGVRTDASVPLAPGPCDDWRGALQADFSDAAHIHFAGAYPVACGEKAWPIAYADPARYDERALAGLWQEMGGHLGGVVREGAAPTTPPSFEVSSPALADVVRDVNKFSNNLMAQQLFLTLALTQRGLGTPELARQVLSGWATDRLGAAAAELVIDNGSGLSRASRLSAQLLARLLQLVWASPWMPELSSSLPISGIDGTLKRSGAAIGRAHLKTGSLRDVSAIAGYVLGNTGRRYVVVAIVNDPNAGAGRPALDALLKWVVRDEGD